MISIWEWLSWPFGSNFICVHFRFMGNPRTFSVSMQIYCNFWKRVSKATCQKTQKTMLGFVASVLAVLCKWKQQLPIMLELAVYRGKDTTHTTLETMRNARERTQQCWKSCANDPTLLRATLRRSRKKRNVRSCLLKSLTAFKLFSTNPNNTQQRVQTDGTCNIQQCFAPSHGA